MAHDTQLLASFLKQFLFSSFLRTRSSQTDVQTQIKCEQKGCAPKVTDWAFNYLGDLLENCNMKMT